MLRRCDTANSERLQRASESLTSRIIFAGRGLSTSTATATFGAEDAARSLERHSARRLSSFETKCFRFRGQADDAEVAAERTGGAAGSESLVASSWQCKSEPVGSHRIRNRIRIDAQH